MPGGDNGGTARLWEAVPEIWKTFLAVAWDSFLFPSFLEDEIAWSLIALDELLMSVADKIWSFERASRVDSIIEVKTPDSLSAWIMTYW